MRALAISPLARFGLLAGCLIFAGATVRGCARTGVARNPPSLAQVVALDECDPTTFNAALGPDFCKNVALAAIHDIVRLISEGRQPELRTGVGTSNLTHSRSKKEPTQRSRPGRRASHFHRGGAVRWRFHTGAQCAGEDTVPECAGGFSKVEVARTRILQGSHVQVTGLSKGEHRFQCCIHPWMRVKVEVK